MIYATALRYEHMKLNPKSLSEKFIDTPDKISQLN